MLLLQPLQGGPQDLLVHIVDQVLDLGLLGLAGQLGVV